MQTKIKISDRLKEMDIPPLYSTENDEPHNIKVKAKLFTPWTGATWYVTEYDPVQNLAFGLAQIFESELGYISITELEEIESPMGLGVEIDEHYAEEYLDVVMKRS